MDKLFSFLIIIAFLLISRHIKADCTFNYNDDFPTIPSVLLTSPVTLLEPKYTPIRLNFLQYIDIACPGPNNVIEVLNQQYARGYCIYEKRLCISGKPYTLSQLGCRTKVQAECRRTATPCGNNDGTSFVVEIGYKLSIFSELTLFYICYNYTSYVPLYATETIYGATISLAKGSLSRPSFKIGCDYSLLTQAEIDNAYTQARQLTTFENLLESTTLASRYIVASRSYLAKGHLIADANQVLTTSRTATYFYVNSVPMWQQVNNGNWKSLESSIRLISSKLGENFEILTGGHGILTLPDVFGRESKIYLADNYQLAVPKYLWKIIYSIRLSSGMAFIALNNPFYTKLTMDICPNICDYHEWGTISWRDPSKGLLYCCAIEDLIKIVPEISDRFTLSGVRSILRGIE